MDLQLENLEHTQMSEEIKTVPSGFIKLTKTKSGIPIPCPDGIDGCLVAHYTEKPETPDVTGYYRTHQIRNGIIVETLVDGSKPDNPDWSPLYKDCVLQHNGRSITSDDKVTMLHVMADGTITGMEELK